MALGGGIQQLLAARRREKLAEKQMAHDERMQAARAAEARARAAEQGRASVQRAALGMAADAFPTYDLDETIARERATSIEAHSKKRRPQEIKAAGLQIDKATDDANKIKIMRAVRAGKDLTSLNLLDASGKPLTDDAVQGLAAVAKREANEQDSVALARAIQTGKALQDKSGRKLGLEVQEIAKSSEGVGVRQGSAIKLGDKKPGTAKSKTNRSLSLKALSGTKASTEVLLDKIGPLEIERVTSLYTLQTKGGKWSFEKAKKEANDLGLNIDNLTSSVQIAQKARQERRNVLESVAGRVSVSEKYTTPGREQADVRKKLTPFEIDREKRAEAARVRGEKRAEAARNRNASAAELKQIAAENRAEQASIRREKRATERQVAAEDRATERQVGAKERQRKNAQLAEEAQAIAWHSMFYEYGAPPSRMTQAQVYRDFDIMASKKAEAALEKEATAYVESTYKGYSEAAKAKQHKRYMDIHLKSGKHKRRVDDIVNSYRVRFGGLRTRELRKLTDRQ